MTNWTKSAENNLVSDSLVNGKHGCKVCGKLYKNKGTLKNHLHDQHPGEIIFEAEKIAKLHEFVEMQWNHKLLFTYPGKQITKLAKDISEIKEKFMKDFSYNMGHYGEELVLSEAKLHLMVQLERIIAHQENIQDVYVGLCNFRDSLKDEVINEFPRHNSSSEFSNIVDRLKVHASADFVKNRFGSGLLGEMIRCADKLSNWDDKEEE